MSNQASAEITIELNTLSAEETLLPREELFSINGTVLLPVPHFMQENEFSWCYAGCAQMILLAYNKPHEQCEIVGSVKGADCCTDPDRPICVDTGCDHEDIAPIYTTRGVSAVRHQPHGLISLAALQTELSNRRPVEVTLAADGGFHAVVVRGFKGSLLFINDPLEEPVEPLDYSYLQEYDDLVENEYYTWDETWTGFPPIN